MFSSRKFEANPFIRNVRSSQISPTHGSRVTQINVFMERQLLFLAVFEPIVNRCLCVSFCHSIKMHILCMLFGALIESKL